MPGAKNFRARGGEGPKLAIRTVARKDESRLSLIEFARDPTHLLFAQRIGAFNYSKRIALQRCVREDINDAHRKPGHQLNGRRCVARV